MESERGRRWLAIGSVAAVLVLGAGLAGSVLRDDGGGHTTTNAVGPAADSKSERSPASAAAPAAAPGQARDTTTVSGDIGEIPDAATLVARIGRTVRSAAAAAATSPPQAPGSSGPGSVPLSGAVGTRPCELEGRSRGADLGAVVYMATGTNAGTPVVVLGFAPARPTGPITVEVLARPDCRFVFEATVP